MRILQINGVYGVGSTGKITQDLHTELLKCGFESYVCYGRGKYSEDPYVYKISDEVTSKIRRAYSMISGKPYSFTKFTNRKLIQKIKEIKPDLVHLQCINGYFCDIYRLFDYLKNNNIPTLLTLHAEFMYTGGCGYALDCNQWKNGCKKCNRLKTGLGVVGLDRVKKNYDLMREAVNGFEKLTVVGVSEWISERALESRIMCECNVVTVRNGIETKKIFHPQNAQRVIEKYGLDLKRSVVLSVLPNLESDLKGGKVMMQLAQLMEASKYQFVVVGARGEVKDKPENMVVIAYTESQNELAELYSAADVFVIGSKMDNYPTVCIEANSCGTPVVGFDVGGVSETIYPEMGEVVPYGDMENLVCCINKWSKLKHSLNEELITAASLRNSKERMVKEYMGLYDRILEGT